MDAGAACAPLNALLNRRLRVFVEGKNTLIANHLQNSVVLRILSFQHNTIVMTIRIHPYRFENYPAWRIIAALVVMVSFSATRLAEVWHSHEHHFCEHTPPDGETATANTLHINTPHHDANDDESACLLCSSFAQKSLFVSDYSAFTVVTLHVDAVSAYSSPQYPQAFSSFRSPRAPPVV